MGSLAFQLGEVHFGVHLETEKSLPNPIAFAQSQNIRNMAGTDRAWREKKKKRKRRAQKTQTVSERRQLQKSK